MVARNLLKTEIDRLDDRYLELVYKIIRQFPHVSEQPQTRQQKQPVASIFQEIADSGGLGISDPLAWQQEMRRDRTLPFRTD